MKRISIVISLFLIGTGFAQSPLQSQIYYGGNETYILLNSDSITPSGEAAVIYQFDPERDEVSEFYRSEFGQMRVSLSPNGQFIGSIQFGGGGSEYVNNLIILDRQGNIYRQIDEDVRRYAWSPDGKQIAYIVGKDREGGIGFSPEQIVIYDMIRGVINRKPGIPHDLVWAAFDNNIYYYTWDKDRPGGANWMVFRLNPGTGSADRTEYRDIYFSPGGTYYYMADRERGGGQGLVSRVENKIITLPENLPLVDPRRANWSWLSDNTVVYSSPYPSSRGTVIYRIDTGTVLFQSRAGLRKVIPAQRGLPARIYTETEEIILPGQGQIKRKSISWRGQPKPFPIKMRRIRG